MLISFVIILVCAICFIRCASFGIRLVKDKNILGAVSVFVLSLLVLASLYFTI